MIYRTSLSAAFASALMIAPAPGQERIDMKLVDAGFIMREADTPQKMARLKTIPPRKFVARSKNGVRYYVYADPDYCKCALVGGQEALDAYRDAVARTTGSGLPGYSQNDPSLPVGGDNVERDMMSDINVDGGSPDMGDDGDRIFEAHI
ncbi:MAG: hypothetical protein AB7F51_16195 [Pseudorhodoplanes sp.]